jgi:hypothetical protein
VSQPGPPNDPVKRARLAGLYQAYLAYEVATGRPARAVEALPLEAGDVLEFKQ